MNPRLTELGHTSDIKTSIDTIAPIGTGNKIATQNLLIPTIIDQEGEKVITGMQFDSESVIAENSMSDLRVPFRR